MSAAAVILPPPSGRGGEVEVLTDDDVRLGRARMAIAGEPFLGGAWAWELSGNVAQVLGIDTDERPRLVIGEALAHRIDNHGMPDPGPANRAACVAAMADAWGRR